MKIKILEVSRQNGLIDKAVDFFWNCWGNDNNFNFYKDCIAHSCDAEKGLPGFYVVLNHSEIIASYALLVNDLISRQDLLPWLACLYVDEKYWNKGIAGQLLKHGLQEARRKGYDKLYLSTDLEGFYEKYGWRHFANGFNIVDIRMKIYAKSTF